MRDDGYSLQDLGGLLRRRAAFIGVLLLAFPLASIIIAYSIETLYESTGTIVIEQPEVSESFLPGDYQDANRGQQISRLYDEFMTRDNLAEIIERQSLYMDLRVDGAAESAVSELRDKIELDFILAENDPRNKNLGEVIGFNVSFFHPDALTARNVARAIIKLLLDGNRARRQDAYDQTAAALDREADNLRVQVSAVESSLAKFKTTNPGALPEDRTYNRQIVERKSRDLDGLDREIRSLRERKTFLQSQLAQTQPWATNIGPDGELLPTSSERLRTLQAEYLLLLGNYNANHPDVLRLRREIESLSGSADNPAFRRAVESELYAKRAELLDARILYGSDHPDIRNLERAVAALQQQIQSMPSATVNSVPPNNPTYINIDLQLNGVDSELIALRFDRQKLQADIRDLDVRVRVAPEVEREYLDLTRDLGLARKQYEDIRSRQMAVERAGILENENLTERFVVTRSPVRPISPAYPNRPLFVVVGLFLGMTFAIGLAIVAETLDGTVRSTRDITTILGMPPVAAVPLILTVDDLRRQKSVRLASSAGTIVLIVAVAAYVHLQRTGAI